MVLDLGLPDMTGFELIERFRREVGPLAMPIIVFTNKDLTRRGERAAAAGGYNRRQGRQIDRSDLLDQTALFLHRAEANLPESARQMLEQLHRTDPCWPAKRC